MAVYNGGPLWKAGYRWQSVYWGSYWKGTPALAPAQVDKAVADIDADASFWGGLSEYNVGMGTENPSVIIGTDPPATIDDSQIGPQITAWIRAGTIPELGQQGAYNIFVQPGTTITLQGSASCESFCLPPDEVLLGDNKEIRGYMVSDRIVGRSGLETVQHTFERDYAGDLIEIKGQGLLPFRVTPNHPVMVVKGTIGRHKKTVLGEPIWKEALDLKEKHADRDGDYLLLPTLQEGTEASRVSLVPWILGHSRIDLTSFQINKETAWLLGVYVAEGCKLSARRIRFVINETEDNLARRIAEIAAHLGYKAWAKNTYNGRNGHGKNVCIASAVLTRFFSDSCGNGANHKKIPDFILFNGDLSILRSFLDGYLEGDGCHARVGKRRYEATKFATTSKVLALQLQLAFARLGKFVSLRRIKPSKHTIRGRPFIPRVQYEGQVYTDGRIRHRYSKGFLIVPVQKVTRTDYSGKVYNVATPDHTYLVSNAIVHNCDFHNFDGTHFYTVEPYPCSSGCNQCTSSDFDTLTQGLSEEMVELATDMSPGTGWVIGQEELCDHCDTSFVCHQISTGEYVNAWYSDAKGKCWGP